MKNIEKHGIQYFYFCSRPRWLMKPLVLRVTLTNPEPPARGGWPGSGEEKLVSYYTGKLKDSNPADGASDLFLWG